MSMDVVNNSPISFSDIDSKFEISATLQFCFYCKVVVGCCMFVCLCWFVYEDSNFEICRIPGVCAYAHKWLEPLASATSVIRSELWREHASFWTITCTVLNFLMMV